MNRLGLGSTVRVLREANNATMTELSVQAGISTSLLSLIESDKREPSMKVLRQLAKALQIPFEALILASKNSSESLSSSNPIVGKLEKILNKMEGLRVDLRDQLKEFKRG